MQKITIRNTETGEETEATPEQLARFIEELQLHIQNQYNVLTDLRKEFAELKKQNQWQPIETAPKDDDQTLILLFPDKHPHTNEKIISVGEGYWAKYAGFFEECWCRANLDSEYGKPIYPTHWMPLPKAPEVK